MSIISFPFTSVNGDRKMKAADFRRYWNGFTTNGIIPGVLNECQCSTNGMNVVISSGVINIQGALAVIESAENVPISQASYDRSATVVLEFNDNSAYRNIHTNVIYGTSNTLGVLTQNDTVWQLPLCTLLIPAYATSLASIPIADERAYAQLRVASATVANPVVSISRSKHASSGYLWGDANKDGSVSSSDVDAIAQSLVGLGSIDTAAADLDGDGAVTPSDIVRLTRLIQNMGSNQVIERTELTYANGAKKVIWGYADA